MKNHDFESLEKEYKDINNNLAVPLYRSFCKAYGISFHFGDEIKNFDKDKHPPILIDEASLHGDALSLFNFINKPYHSFKNKIVSFVYTSWSDFDYEQLSLEEVANEMENKDIILKELQYKSRFYENITSILSFILAIIISIQIYGTNYAALLIPFIIIVSIVLPVMIPQLIYNKRKKIEQSKFEKKLSELQIKLEDISVKYEQSEILEKPVKLNLPQPFNPIEFPTLVKYDSQIIEDSIQKLMKDRSMTRQQCLVNLEQDLSEIEAQSGKSEE